MANHARSIVLSEDDCRELERLQRSPSLPAGVMRRARVMLLLAQEVSGVEIARLTGYTVVQVSRLRRRFAETGMAGLQDQPRSGRPPTVTARKTARIVALTLKPPPPGVTHWSTRDLAETGGVSAYDGASDLARACVATAPAGDLQIQHRPGRRDEDLRCGRVVPAPAPECRRA